MTLTRNKTTATTRSICINPLIVCVETTQTIQRMSKIIAIVEAYNKNYKLNWELSLYPSFSDSKV